MRLALAGGPEFVNEIGNAVLLELNRLGAKGVEAAKLGEERVARYKAVIARGAANEAMRSGEASGGLWIASRFGSQ